MLFRSRLKEENKLVNITAKPLNDRFTSKRFVIVSFESVDNPVKEDDQEVPEKFDLNNQLTERFIELEKELQFTKENLQATIEELETSNEELQSTNEELIASNEELQSTNEELQSVNEELYTVNSEYQKKIEELTQLNNDMNNLLKNTNIGILYLDRHLKIRKYTSMITRVINVMEMDINRPIRHISLNVKYRNFIKDIEEVRDTLQSKETELQDNEGNWNLIRILPYRTLDNAIEGITVTIVDISKLKQSERKVETIGNQLELVLSVGNVAWWDWNYLTHEVKFSDEKALMLGYDPKELNKFDVYDWTNQVHPQDYEPMMKAMKDHLEGKTIDYQSIYRIKAKNGTWKWFYDKGSVVERDVANKPVRITGIVLDMTSLKESENRYKYLFDSMYQGVVYQDVNGHIIAANAAAEHILGLTADQLMGRRSADPRWKAIHSDGSDFPGETHPSMVALKTGKEVSKQLMGIFHPVKNKYCWILVSAMPQFREGEVKPFQVFTTFDDITDQIEAEKEITRMNKLLFRVLDNSSDGKLVVDKTGKITYVNKRVETLFQRPASEIVNRFYNDASWKSTDADGKTLTDEMLPFALVVETKTELRNFIMTIEGTDHQPIELKISGSPIYDENGEVEGVVFSIE